MEVSVHQIQLERDEQEEEEEEEMLMRRKRWPEEKEGSNSNNELSEPENGKSKDELFVPENGKSKDELLVTENDISNDEVLEPENGKSKDVPENGKSKDELSVTENDISNDEVLEPENGKSKDEFSMPVNGHVQVSDNAENGHVQSTVVNNQYQQSLKDDSLPDIELLLAENPVENPQITQSSSKVTANGVDTEVLKKEELNDLDVERVLKEQNTHDLFCPNCRSCITTKVILRKRKRGLKISDEDGKRIKPEIVDAISEQDNQSHATINITVDSSSQTLPADEYNRYTEPEVFRCLSCFTFFIPTVFRDKREKENLQREQISSVKKNWLSSLFSSRKEEMLLAKDVKANITEASRQEIDSSPSALVVNSSSEGPEVVGKVVENRGEKSDEVQQEAIGLPGKDPLHGEVSEENATYKLQGNGLNFLVKPTTEASALEKSQRDQKLITTTGNKGTYHKNWRHWLFPGTHSVYGESENNKKVDLVADFPSQKGQNFEVNQSLPIQSTVDVQNVHVTFSDSSHSYPSGFPHNNAGTKVDIHIEKTQIANADASNPSLTTPLLLPDNRVPNTTKDLMVVSENTGTGGDTVIIVTENPAQQATSQQAQDIITSQGTGLSCFTESAEDREYRGVEVIKSIVYGGLVETVTSLGIVSSAAGSDTAIINIVALGLANLFGGLFIICHSLWDLKNDDYGLVSGQVTENAPTQRNQRIDKYRDLLGRRENFILHATIAILSYLIFGLLPPVVYGFSFRQSNERYYKLITVSAASFLCIAVLSLGKAYVQRRPKPYVKTVFYYVALGFMASGVSYVAGDLVKTWIEKLGWLSSGTDLSVPIMRKSPAQTGWSSY